MKSTLLALLLYSIISVSNSEEIFISDSNFISKIDDTKNKNYNDVFSQHNFIYEGSLIKHDSSENGLGRYYRYCSDDKYNHTACPFPEYYKCIDERCIRRSLNFDDEFEIAGFCLIFILIIFANIAGLSGGYLTVIVLYEVFGFESRKTFGYAAFINLCAVVVRYIYYFRFKNPVKEYQTLIDYEMALILFPLSIFGIICGSLLYNVLPMLAIAILDGLCWSVIAIIILVKTIRLFKSEKLIESVKSIKKINESKSDLSYIKMPHQRKMLKEHEKGDKRMHSLNSENNRLSESNKINLKETCDKNPSLTEDKIMLNDELSLETNNQHLYTDESTITPRMIDKMKYLDENNKSESDENREFFKSIQNTVILNPGDQSNLAKNIEEMMYLQKMFKSKLNESSETHNELKVIQQAEGSHFGIKIFFVLLNAFLLFSNEIMRGESQDSFIGISQCSIGDWILLIIVSISAIAISATTVNYIISMFNKKMKAGYALIPSDINWNYTNSAYLLALSFVFGVIGGISNIGEGTPYAMLLIMLGKHPFVATSTGMFMSIVYSSAISCVYAIEGFFDDEYYLFLGAIAIIGSLIGMFLCNRIFDIVNRSSLLFFLLSINCLVIGICLTHQIINRKFQDGSVRNTITDFGSYCNKNS